MLSDGKYQLPPRGLEGPWEIVTADKAHAKTIQVLRDMKHKALRQDEVVFEEADQVEALASVNASMKESTCVHPEQQQTGQAVGWDLNAHPPGATDQVAEAEPESLQEMSGNQDMAGVGSGDHIQVNPEAQTGQTHIV